MLLSDLTEEQRAELDLAVRHELWRAGDITYKLHSDQREVWDDIKARDSSREVLEISRKWGKTFFLVLYAFDVCLNKAKARVVYGAPTLKHLAEFVLPVVDEICADAPAEVRPHYNQQTGHLEFPHNGSYVHLFGADDKAAAERGRGPKADAAIFDEAGFCSVLLYVLRDVFRPQLMYSRGRTLLGSTPSSEPEHDFTAIAERAEAQGTYARRTIYDNPLLTDEEREKFISDSANDEGFTVDEYKRTPTFRREYLAERIVDTTLAVMGDDWQLMGERCMREVARPRFFDAYTILDMGGVDPHAVIFGYWHFELGAFVQEDELLLRDGCNTAMLAERIKEKERALWGTDQFVGTLRGLSEVERKSLPTWLQIETAKKTPPAQPYLRFCDNDIQIAKDLHELHGISFIPTEKHEKRLQVNAFRVSVRAGRYFIHPRCRDTIRHFRTTTWANARQNDYKRKNGEHGDLLDCNVYGERNYRKNRNPTPENWGVDLTNMWIPEKPKPLGNVRAMAGLRRK